ncbi:hypothetical protein CK503_15350 [Aliifodinibius salipaludis]|uniref:Uncharacterized protein n=2 Tax=Fodinibius salipaludis TaxID=2032627 RepID=A0A2A2G612_9BACT|nr:hypothetical protein CK503_15350 [Aliifodinibius salipaludis]
MKVFNLHIKVIALLVFACACLGIPDNALGQTEALDKLVERADNAGIERSVIEDLKARKEARGLSNQQLENMIEPAVQLAEDNLPANHVLQKALEGLSKGVPDARIVPYINRMSSATRQAAEVVDPWMEKPEVRQIMDRQNELSPGESMRNRLVESSSRAITQNVSPENISQLLADVGEKSVLSKTTGADIVSAMDIVSDLPMQDHPELTRSFITRALKGGFRAGEFQKLPMALNMAQKRSQIPASNIIQGVGNQLQKGVPAQDILQNLFDGNIGGGPPGDIPKGMENNRGKGNRGNNSGNG